MLLDAPMGGWGACLFLGISAGKVLEQEAASPYTPTPTCPLRPGETEALTAPSCKAENDHFGDKQRGFKRGNLHDSVNI